MPLPKEDSWEVDAEAYWSLPEGRRAELIDGRLYDMAPPSRQHQRVVSELTRILGNYIAAHGGPCEVYPAPFAVNLDGDDRTWVEPDISIICDPDKLSDRGCEGAPDLTIEVVSPSTQRTDYITKAFHYEWAGVREYWIVDVDAAHTMVYRFSTGDACPRMFALADPVPVGIWDGDLSITVADLLV